MAASVKISSYRELTSSGVLSTIWDVACEVAWFTVFTYAAGLMVAVAHVALLGIIWLIVWGITRL